MEELVPGLLWTDYAAIRMAGLPAGRRATIARNANGRLVVFSPLRATGENLDKLRRLPGEPAAFVIPSRVHDSFFDDYFAEFPSALFFAGGDALKDHRTWPLEALDPKSPELAGFRFHLVEGMPRCQEHVFLHEASRTLVVADLLFNIPRAKGWVTRLLMRMADMGGRPRPSRLWRSLIRSDEKFAASLNTIRTWDFDRIVPGHGEVIESDAKRVFEEAFARWLG